MNQSLFAKADVEFTKALIENSSLLLDVYSLLLGVLQTCSDTHGIMLSDRICRSTEHFLHNPSVVDMLGYK